MSRPRRRRLLAATTVLVLGAFSATALAAWSAFTSGNAEAVAATMPTGSTPTARASGSTTTVVWNAAHLPDGTAVAGYIVNRYDATTGARATVGTGCSGTISATSCSEQSVPTGNWVYTDTPIQASWTGGESGRSNAVTTSGAAASLTSSRAHHAATLNTASPLPAPSQPASKQDGPPRRASGSRPQTTSRSRGSRHHARSRSR